MKADAAARGDGSRSRPFATLEQVEKKSQPGDTIRVLPSTRPLDRGIQLKDDQRLIGDGDPVTKAPPAGAHPTISNTTQRYNGDGIRLADNNLVQNLHIDGASSYCATHAPDRAAAPTTGPVVIDGNVIRAGRRHDTHHRRGPDHGHSPTTRASVHARRPSRSLAIGRKAHRATPEPPYNPHRVAAA